MFYDNSYYDYAPCLVLVMHPHSFWIVCLIYIANYLFVIMCYLLLGFMEGFVPSRGTRYYCLIDG
jgi:hypothetical protein